MKPLIQANKRHPNKPGRTMVTLTALLVGVTCTGQVNAQENIQTETQLKLPAEQAEELKQNKAIKKQTDDKTDDITPSEQKENQASQPGNIKDSDKLPAVQKDKLPAVQRDRLPESQRDKLPAVQEPQPISDDPGDAPFADGTALPDGAGMPDTGGPATGKPAPELPSPDFGDALPDDAGKPDTGGPAAGGFAPKSVDLDPEVAFGEYPRWTRDYGRLHYGANEEVSFTVVNGGERETSFRTAYQIEDQAPQTSSVMNLGPGEEKPVSIDVDLTSLSPAAEARILRDQELRIRIFIAHGSPVGRHDYNGLLYRDARVQNHTWERNVTVRADVDVSVELNRMRQYALCENWAQSRDWIFLISISDEDFIWHDLDGKPPFLDSSVRAAHALSPPARYTLSLRMHEGEVQTTPLLYAVKDNGRIKNSGRGAGFDIREPFGAALVSSDGISSWVRSRDHGGRFCGSNLELRYHMQADLVPPRD